MSINIIFTNWKRKNNLLQILNETLNQTLLPIIHIVDNSSNDNDFKIEFENTNIIKSDNSLMCWKRWEVAFDLDSKYICIMDDDLIFSHDNVLKNCYDYMENNKNIDAIGYEGVIKMINRNYVESKHISPNIYNDIKVDIIKGRFFFLKKESLNFVNKNPDLTCDDIKVSSHLTNKYIPSILYNSFEDLEQGTESLSYKSYQKEKREYAFKKYFK